jgi:hypothetical protein
MADSEEQDPFTKIKFNPHIGIMTFAPIRPGVLKEIGPIVNDVALPNEPVQ